MSGLLLHGLHGTSERTYPCLPHLFFKLLNKSYIRRKPLDAIQLRFRKLPIVLRFQEL